MKLFWRVALGIMTAALTAGGVWYAFSGPAPHTNIKLGEAHLQAKVVIDETERTKGLSGSQPLREGEAMLFVFPSDDTWGIWMKDMNYPIDIMWLDKDKIVKHVVEDAQPSSYPSIFRPAEEVRYVLETKSGTVKQKHITIGSKAEFTLP